MSFLIISFEEVIFSPGDLVIRMGELGDAMYIVVHGKVGVHAEETGSPAVAFRTKGTYFGEIALVFPLPRTAWIVAVHYLVLMRLTKVKFDYILHECPSEKDAVLSRVMHDFKKLIPDLNERLSDTNLTVHETAAI